MSKSNEKMKILPIVIYGSPILRKQALEIEKGTDIRDLVNDMFATLDAASGIGLSAPQVGESLQLFVVNILPLEENSKVSAFKKVFINPTILKEWGDSVPFREGCLSIPSIREIVNRKYFIKIGYYNTDFEYQEEEYNEIRARVIQHECDHLRGKLFIDHLSQLKKRLLAGKFTKIVKGKFKVNHKIKFDVK